jgi:hypothetical protein
MKKNLQGITELAANAQLLSLNILRIESELAADVGKAEEVILKASEWKALVAIARKVVIPQLHAEHSTACTKENWCVLQGGHPFDCSATFKLPEEKR